MLTQKNTPNVECYYNNCSKEYTERRKIMKVMYLSELTEEQIKQYCIELLETYPKCKKELQVFMESLEDKLKHFQECIDNKEYSEALKYEMCEEDIEFIRKNVNKLFAIFTNVVKRFLEATQDKSYATENYYLKVKELNQNATEYRKEVRKKLGIYKDKYRVYRIELRGTDRIIDFMDIIKETCR